MKLGYGLINTERIDLLIKTCDEIRGPNLQVENIEILGVKSPR